MADENKKPKDSKPEKKAEKKVEKKAEKKSSEKKSVFGSIKQFFKDVKGETKKIVWNSFPNTIKDTGVVLMVTLIIGAGVWISDYVFSWVVNLIGSLGGQDAETAMIMLQSLTNLF